MVKVNRINTSQVEGGYSDDSDKRPNGEMALYNDDNGGFDLVIHDGVNSTNLNKVLGKGKFYGHNADSGDGNGYDTIKLIPDIEAYNNGSHQYLIIDPTAPNHIHIRAGGTIDNSNSELFLGGENSFVSVGAGQDPAVSIRSNNNDWSFSSTGALVFPTGTGINNIEINPGGIIFSDGTNQTSAFNNTAISGILSTNIVSGTGISLVYNAIDNNLTVNSNGLIPVVDLGTLTGTNAINGGVSNAFQKITLNGTSVTFTKGTGWPTDDSLLIDSILKITVTSPTSITWSIINEWYNQPPAGALGNGVHLFGLRAVGIGVIEGHYIGNKTN
jgi:hypothetical protein